MVHEAKSVHVSQTFWLKIIVPDNNITTFKFMVELELSRFVEAQYSRAQCTNKIRRRIYRSMNDIYLPCCISDWLSDLFPFIANCKQCELKWRCGCNWRLHHKNALVLQLDYHMLCNVTVPFCVHIHSTWLVGAEQCFQHWRCLQIFYKGN